MKIVFVISSLAAGGAERVVTTLANRLAKEHNVIVATFSDEEPFYPLAKGVTHRRLHLIRPSRNLWEKTRNTVRRVRKLSVFLKETKPDVAVSFMTQTNLLAVLAAKTAGVPLVVSERIAYDFHDSGLLNIARRLLYPLAGALVTQTRADLEHYSFVNDALAIPNPLYMETGRVCETFRDKEKIVLGVGRLEPQKGFDTLIRAFHRAGRKEWRLIIAGEGSHRAALESLIRETGAKNIELVGRQKDIFAWYARAAIFVLSSRREGFPNVLTEAMACRCAAVSFDCPYGPGEIIDDGRNGLLLRHRDERALASALVRLMDNPSLRRSLALEAARVQETYDAQRIAKQWEELFKRVAG